MIAKLIIEFHKVSFSKYVYLNWNKIYKKTLIQVIVLLVYFYKTTVVTLDGVGFYFGKFHDYCLIIRYLVNFPIYWNAAGFELQTAWILVATCY